MKTLDHKLFSFRASGFAWLLTFVALSTSSVFSQDHDPSPGDGNEHAATPADAEHGPSDHDHVNDDAGVSHPAGHDPVEHDPAHAGEHGHGAPALKEDLAIWSFVAFLGFLFALSKLGIFEWMFTSMANREKEQNETISVAESHLAKARSDLNQYRGQLEAMDETIAEILAEAGSDADHTKQQIADLADRESKLLVQRAEVEISRARDQSLHALFEHLATSVSQAVEARVRENIQSQDQDRLIDDTLSQLSAS